MRLALWEYRKLTKEFEGLRCKPYKCTAGKLTIGYGRNLDDTGISADEAEYMFNNDFNSAYESVLRLLKANSIDVNNLSECRLFVLTDMMFNLGYNRLSGFKKLLQALKKGDYEAASNEMKDSNWYKQTGNRAKKLCSMMKNNA